MAYHLTENIIHIFKCRELWLFGLSDDSQLQQALADWFLRVWSGVGAGVRGVLVGGGVVFGMTAARDQIENCNKKINFTLFW